MIKALYIVLFCFLIITIIAGCNKNSNILHLHDKSASLSAPAPPPKAGYIEAVIESEPDPRLVGLFQIDLSATHSSEVKDWKVAVAALPNGGYAVSVNDVSVNAVISKKRIDFEFSKQYQGFNKGYVALETPFGKGPFLNLWLRNDKWDSKWYCWGAFQPVVPGGKSIQ